MGMRREGDHVRWGKCRVDKRGCVGGGQMHENKVLTSECTKSNLSYLSDKQHI